MKVSSKDVELLKQVRGTFSRDKETTLTTAFFIILFALILPSLFIFAIVKEGFSNTVDGWGMVIITFGSFFVGAFCWYYFADKYEFNGSNITILRRGKKVNEFNFNDIQDIEISKNEHGNVFMAIKSHKKELTIAVYPSLQEAIESLQSE